MGQHYSQLSKEERQSIYRLLDRKISLTEIAKIVGRHHSTLYRELRRNYFSDKEYPEYSGWFPPHGRQTMTFDRGTEFMAWRNLHRTAGMKSYFCDVASPWQKGSVEICL
jgi:IS30 family transposase